MRWGIELWDRFDDVSNYVHKGIEFCEKYEDFCKKRCTIENNYAKHLRKLIEASEPKKKESEENDTSYMKCFVKMLNELKDIAGQHELVAENIEERIILKLSQLIKALKDERKKFIDEKDKYLSELIFSDEMLDKTKQKYERSFKELEKAKELYFKIDNDDHASKSDIRKQKHVVELKQNNLNLCEAEYGKQLCEANKVKSLYYRDQLPSVLNSMQTLDSKRIENFRSCIYESVRLESEIMPRIERCQLEIKKTADMIDPLKDTELAVTLYKTGYNIPDDYVFEDLNEKNSYTSISNSNGQCNRTNGSSTLNSNSNGVLSNQLLANLSSTTLSHNSTTRQRKDKYRTINRFKNLFQIPGSGRSDNDLCNLPPQQLKKELSKKIENLKNEIVKQQKEREGIIKLRDIYSKNQNLGDVQSTSNALITNEEKLNNLTNQLKNYQDIYTEVEQTGYYNFNNKKQTSIVYSNNNGTNNGTLPRSKQASEPISATNNNNHIYQSPSQYSVNSGNNSSSIPGTPVSHHSTNNYAGSNEISIKSSLYNSSSIGAYAISPLNNNQDQMKQVAISINHCTTNNNNESFDEDDDEDIDDDGCYENPAAALKAAKLKQQQQIHNQQLNFNFMNQSSGVVSKASIESDSSSTKVTTIQTTNIVYSDDHIDGQSIPITTAHDYDKDDVIIGTALVIYAFEGTVQNAMSIQENESLNVLEKDSGDGWTLVKRLNGEKGYVPTDYIRIAYY